MITQSEYEFFSKIAVVDQKHLKTQLTKMLQKRYDTVIENEKFIYAIGDIDIALMAHLDTVFPEKEKNIFCDREREIFWSPEGLGADDRAGVYAILEILIKYKKRPHVIFTLDEELGGIGAKELAKIKNPFSNLKYIIQLDRRGKDDCVFYNCDNEEFEKYIESFGFVTNLGSYSDISFVCPAWKIAGVNLSVGYENEHSYMEYLNFTILKATIQKVLNMLDAANEASIFKYCTSNYECAMCGKAVSKHSGIMAELSDGNKYYFCPKCAEVLTWNS